MFTKFRQNIGTTIIMSKCFDKKTQFLARTDIPHRLQWSRAQKEQLKKHSMLGFAASIFAKSVFEKKIGPLRKKARAIQCTIQN